MNRTFLSLWLIGALTSVARWLELLATSIVGLEMTGSEFQVAMLALVRMAPLVLFGVPMSSLAERMDRRMLFNAAVIVLLVCSLVVAALVRSDSLELWHLSLAAFLSGCLWVFDFAVRRPMIGETVKPETLGRAMGLDTISNNGTRMLGPLLGGVFLQLVGLDGAYVVAAVIYAACFVVVLTLPGKNPHAAPTRAGMWREIREGIYAVSQHRLLIGILAVTITYNLFGFPIIAMIPVVGQSNFALDPAWVGALAGAEGAGALIGGALIAAGAGVGMSGLRRCYFFGLGLNLIGCLVFAMLSAPLLGGTALLISGIGAAGFSSMQTTLLVLNTPERFRARVMGLLSVCIGTALLGFLQIGILAHFFGAESAIILSSLAGMSVLTLIWIILPEIIGIQRPQPNNSRLLE